LNAAVAAERTELFGHPRGLATLFFTEMWERFSFYGMQALLVLFMTEQVVNGGFGLTDQTATAIYGLYTAFVYLVALPGGWIADRLWGARRAIFIGGIIIMCGHFVLAVPGTAAFFGGLMLVVLGTGLLKPNISAVVGELYAENDPRRDAGFTVFYMGINIGAVLGPIVCGFLAAYEWRYGFAAAGFGMLLGLVQYRLMQEFLGSAGLAPATAPSSQFRARSWSVIAIVVVAAFALLYAGVNGLVSFDAVTLAQRTTAALVAGTLAYFAYLFVAGRLTPLERRRVLVILVLVLASAVFWAGFEQFGSSLNLFAERYTLREVVGFEIPTSWFQSLNPFFLIVLAPFFSMFWIWLARRHLEPSAPAKFAFGLILLGCGFVVMIGAAALVAQGQQVLPTWLIFTYLFHTMGELALSPVGLSAMTKLAPRRFVGQMMGMWFLCTALGSAVAGLIAGSFDTEALETWPWQYTQIALIAVGCGLVLLVLARPLRRLAAQE
jgi:proton-dependent oligopeptide transporter, POT family